MKYISKLGPLVVLITAMGGGMLAFSTPGQELTDLALEYRARFEMKGITSTIRLDMIGDHPIPRDIVTYIRENADSQGADSGTDPWGTEWRTTGSPRRLPFILISCGPDTQCRTSDDIEVQVIDKDGRFQSKRTG